MLLDEVQSYQNLELLARQVVEGFITGMHASPFHGFSAEFAEHKAYNSGESTRHLDWKLMARTDRLYVKRYEEETNLRCRLVLDLSPSMFYPAGSKAKVRFAALACASIAQLLKKQRDAFSLTAFNTDILFQTAMRSSPRHFDEVIQKLQPVWDGSLPMPAASETRLAPTLEYLAQTTHRRSLIVLFSDMFDSGEDETALWRALQHLRYGRNEVILFHIRHNPDEVDFAFDNRPYRFVDLESGEKLLVNPAELREYYNQRVADLDERIRTKCLQYRIDFYPIDVSRDFQQVLMPFYAKRMRMA
ncbi:MAG: DUF58 domain-containing protein [Bacteroidetes bacterium]|nr:DUF58 domain-containing protein [Bacteroidota bacterium]